MPAVLQGRSGPILLDAPLFTLGCDPSNLLVLEDANASNHHAVLQCQEGSYALMDLGSSNETYLNEQRLEGGEFVALKDGDRLRIGETVFTYEEGSPFGSAQPLMKEAKSVSEQDAQSKLPDTLPSPAPSGYGYTPLPQQEDPEIRGVSRRAVLIRLATVGAVIVRGSAISVLSSHSVLSRLRPKPASTLLVYSGHSGDANSVAWSPNGKWIASASLDGTVQIWEPLTGKRLLVYRGQPEGVNSVAWSPNGKFLASGGPSQTAQVWDAVTGKTLLTYRERDTINTVAWSPDGTRLATFSHDVHVWDTKTGKSLYSIPDPDSDTLSSALAWSPYGNLLAASPSTAYGVASIYNVQNGAQVAVCSAADPSEEVSCMSWAPDGHALASGGGQSVRVWDTESTVLSIYKGHRDWINAVAWSPSSKQIASASGTLPMGQDDTAVHISDAATAHQVSVSTGHSDPVTSVAWSPNGKFLASGSVDTTVHVWRGP